MSENKEYLFIAGDAEIFIKRGKGGKVVTASINGEIFKELEDIKDYKDFENYEESDEPLLEFARRNMVTYYKGQFESERENFLILSGAGTSKGIGKTK